MEMSPTALSSIWTSLVKQQEKRISILGEPHVFFDELYRQYYSGVLAFLRFLVGTPEVAEDLTSLVFEKALTHLAALHTPEAAGSWLFRIARNCAMDHFRRSHPTLSLEHLTDQPVEKPLEETVVAREEQRLLLKQVNRLSVRERELIGLRYVADLNNREIAEVLQIPEGTVSSLLSRALSRLRVALRKEEGTV